MKIIKIGTSHCGPCKAQDKELQNLKNIEIEYVDGEENEDFIDKYNIASVPTTLIVDDSMAELHRFTGLVKADVIRNILQTLGTKE